MKFGRSLLLVLIFVASCLALAQEASPTTSERKTVTRVAPVYPDLARKMHLHGIVKVEAVVRPNGTVKSARALGGNPVLLDAAVDAVKNWKFEPGPNETTEVVQLTFGQ